VSEDPRDFEDESAEEADAEEPEEESETDPYAVLGVSPTASADEVRQSYFRLVRRYPPETHPERFKLVRAAYDALKSPLRRAQREVAQFDLSVDRIDLGRLDSPATTRSSLVAALLAVELAASELARPPSEGDQPFSSSVRESDLMDVDERDLPL
jgi:curved DNA-binding protein CbpA